MCFTFEIKCNLSCPCTHTLTAFVQKCVRHRCCEWWKTNMHDSRGNNTETVAGVKKGPAWSAEAAKQGGEICTFARIYLRSDNTESGRANKCASFGQGRPALKAQTMPSLRVSWTLATVRASFSSTSKTARCSRAAKVISPAARSNEAERNLNSNGSNSYWFRADWVEEAHAADVTWNDSSASREF